MCGALKLVGGGIGLCCKQTEGGLGCRHGWGSALGHVFVLQAACLVPGVVSSSSCSWLQQLYLLYSPEENMPANFAVVLVSEDRTCRINRSPQQLQVVFLQI